MKRMAGLAGVMGLGLVLTACGPVAAPKPGPKVSSSPQAKSAGPKVMRRMGPRLVMNGGWIRASSRIAARNLSTLPPYTYVKQLNPWLRRALQVSTFINGMGYHWVTATPGLVPMTNQAGLVTGVEATFPQKLGSFSWYDPPTTVANAGVAFNSEHLYFVTPSAIVPGMTTTTSDLTSWSAFSAVNTRLTSYTQTGTFMGLTVYAPPGPGIHVLVSPQGSIAGFAVAEPAAWGFHPFYYPGRARPTASPVFGKAYWSILLLQPVPKPATTPETP
jgi:hypothetical protein